MAHASDDPHSLDYHLQELRQRLKYSVVVFAVTAIGGFLVSGRVLSWLQRDLVIPLNAFVPYEALYTQVMIALLIGVIVAVPVLLFEVLRFAKPGLRDQEYRTVRNFLPFSYILFLGGSVFAYEFIATNALQFFQSFTASADVASVWGLQATISFVLRISALTGALFQLPVIAAVLGMAGLLTSEQMRRYRSHFIVAILVVAAVATPPDVLTQVLIVGPVIGLYQVSIWLVGRIED
ncbi:MULTISPECIES: twin-arginine translocase subunit TatC [Haloferacaceae]|uniref:Sec-independent protein translocase protein TatC n=1 Tax=Halorubrum glutamatedens TaxID=2707018 RepID=A0ABD5QNH8_9EURY|nr:twin-arginine translocase subunit TatC [Halobellus captivus]